MATNKNNEDRIKRLEKNEKNYVTRDELNNVIRDNRLWVTTAVCIGLFFFTIMMFSLVFAGPILKLLG